MSFKPHVWDQLRSMTADELIAALTKDGWQRDITTGAVQAYLRAGVRVTVHYHPKKTYGAKLLKGLIADIGWSEDDLRRLKLIK